MRELNHTLKEALTKNSISKIAGCHNPLSAKLAEDAGFDAVWFSGFEFATSMCLPDASILTMSENLTAISSITRTVKIPLLADCDSGFGDANNVAFMVKEYEHAGASGICIEDKLFPKLNSFCESKQDLLPTNEFCLKLIAAASARKSKDFTIIARLESFIAGAGIEDAITRADAYVAAGADALVIHSKVSDLREIRAFFNKIETLSVPAIVIPTTYYNATIEDFCTISPHIKGVIYANQGIRSYIKALKRIYGKILLDGTSALIENELTSIPEAFDYQGMPAFTENQKHFERFLNNIQTLSKVS